MISIFNINRLSFLAALAIAAACLLGSSPARAQSTCTLVDIAPPADPAEAIFSVEGKITAYDGVDRTMTANGMTFTVPSTLLVETRDHALGGNITFDYLIDATLEAQRSIIGGTAIASGTVGFTQTADGYCISFTATAVYVEMAENVLVGLLSNIDPVAGSFQVSGVLVYMNTDPRFPSNLLDAGGSLIPIDDLVGFEGTLVTAGGYFDAAQGIQLGTVVETEAILSQPGTDSVAITRAEGRVDNEELRVEGSNTTSPDTGQYASSVAVHAGGLDAAGTGCAGSQLGTAPVSSIDGTWSLRLDPISVIPSQVCAKSALGGVATRTVTMK